MKYNDTNVGMGMCYDSPEDKEIARLEQRVRDLRAECAEKDQIIARLQRQLDTLTTTP